MSADNYYVVRLHPQGGYTYVMGFASDDDDASLEVTERSPRFASLDEAVTAVAREYAEYGWSIHPEVAASAQLGDAADATVEGARVEASRGHLPGCETANCLCDPNEDCMECHCSCDGDESDYLSEMLVATESPGFAARASRVAAGQTPWTLTSPQPTAETLRSDIRDEVLEEVATTLRDYLAREESEGDPDDLQAGIAFSLDIVLKIQRAPRPDEHDGWLTLPQVTELLGVTADTAREWLEERAILGEQDDNGDWRVSAWQFPQGRTVPRLSALLPLVPEGLSLIAVERFFTEPCDSLVVQGRAVSPIAWLVSGGDAAEIAEMLPFLGLVP